MEKNLNFLEHAPINTSSNYLETLVEFFCNNTPFEFVFIGLFDNPDCPKSATTIYGSSKLHDFHNITYELAGTPCSSLAEVDSCLYSENIQELFPHDEMLITLKLESYCGVRFRDSSGKPVGIFIGVGQQKLQDTNNLKKLFQIFSMRIGLELLSLKNNNSFIQSKISPSMSDIQMLLSNDKLDELKNTLAGLSNDKNKNILFVDDEYDILSIMKETFEEENYNCIGFTHPKDALGFFTLHPDSFGALVTDISMPQMNGLELINNIRKVNPSIPVIILSGNYSLSSKKSSDSISNCVVVEKTNYYSVIPLLEELMKNKTTNHHD